MFNPFEHCREVSPSCPVEGTALGYAPNLEGNLFFAIIFTVCASFQACLAFRYRTYTFGVVVVLGCVMETVGYLLRTSMHYNVWRPNQLMVQAMFVILAPSFLAVGIYLYLEKFIAYLGPQHSIIPPKMLTWVLVGADSVSIVLQAVGGALAFTADDTAIVNTGDNIVVAGLIIGVVVQGTCVALAMSFGHRAWKQRYRLSDVEKATACSHGFIFYASCTWVAFTAILVRSIYRVPELYGGWGNELMRKEDVYMVLEPSMIALASILMTIAHPGIFFPQMSSRPSETHDEKDSLYHLGGKADRSASEMSDYA